MPTRSKNDKKTGRLVGPRPSRSLYDVIAPWVGIASGGPPGLSERTGARCRDALRARKDGAPHLQPKKSE